jgi:putative addiction module component (TIGR02574 family)
MRLADLPDVRALSAREKLQLLDELWQDVAHDLDSLEVSEKEKELLDQRWAGFLRDPAAALSLEQFKERVKAQRPWRRCASCRKSSKM